jgi:hypothetical protein
MGGPWKTPVDKAITAALAAYRQNDEATDRAFRAFEAERKAQGILDHVSEPVRKAYLIAEARALSHIAEVAQDRARTARKAL